MTSKYVFPSQAGYSRMFQVFALAHTNINGDGSWYLSSIPHKILWCCERTAQSHWYFSSFLLLSCYVITIDKIVFLLDILDPTHYTSETVPGIDLTKYEMVVWYRSYILEWMYIIANHCPETQQEAHHEAWESIKSLKSHNFVELVQYEMIQLLTLFADYPWLFALGDEGEVSLRPIPFLLRKVMYFMDKWDRFWDFFNEKVLQLDTIPPHNGATQEGNIYIDR